MGNPHIGGSGVNLDCQEDLQVGPNTFKYHGYNEKLLLREGEDKQVDRRTVTPSNSDHMNSRGVVLSSL